MQKSSRKRGELKKKSIWDPVLVQEVLPAKQAVKMWLWLIRHLDEPLESIPFKSWNVSNAAASRIPKEFVLHTTEIVESFESKRGDTTKLLIRLQDGHQIETVVMKHSGRNTVCVSSQVGCQMGCRFCATGTMGIIGDLTAAEIVEQLVHASRVAPIRNVVFMGMGEPLNNYEAVKLAVEFMIDNKRFGLSPKHVTVSTVGVVNSMMRLTKDLPNVNLALSLHAPNQEIRLKIVPAASANNIDKLLAAVDAHIQAMHGVSGSKVHPFKYREGVMIEYILIHDVNDRPEHAHELGRLLVSRRDHILLNLIPYNPTEVAVEFRPPSPESVMLFHQICCAEPYNLHTRVRQEMGQDIAGACGQLALVKGNTNGRHGDVEDLLQSGFKGKKKVESTKRIVDGEVRPAKDVVASYTDGRTEPVSTITSTTFWSPITLLLGTIFAVSVWTFTKNYRIVRIRSNYA